MSISQWAGQLDFSRLGMLLISALAAVLCICVHESAHGLSALWLGDPTAKNSGRISLNPFHHIDLVGLAMLAIAHVGWAKPVQIDPRYFKNPKLGMALTALAGPVSNFLLAFVTGFIAFLGYYGYLRHPGSSLLYYLGNGAPAVPFVYPPENKSSPNGLLFCLLDFIVRRRPVRRYLRSALRPLRSK